jgi:hypothetical protein
MADLVDFNFLFADNLVNVPHDPLPSSSDGKEAYKKRALAARQKLKKTAPSLGPLVKEAERREVREDFARCRSDKQSDYSEVVENFEWW